MTPLQFVYYAIPLPDRRKKIHLYISRLDSTDDDSPRAQRKGAEDAEHIIRDIVGENCDDTGERLLQAGDPPKDASPIFRFTLGVTFDRITKLCHYSKVGYERIDWDPRFAPIATLGLEQMAYTLSVLRKREKMEYKAWEEANGKPA